MNDRVFTGDTLLINGSGRTDFQGGSAKDQYNSIFGRLLKLPEKTLVYPAHDYNGKKFSTIEDEKNNNPRLQVNSPDEYIEIMNKKWYSVYIFYSNFYCKKIVNTPIWLCT